MAPDHEYPSYLELELTATDARRPHAHGHPAAGPADRARSRCSRARPASQLTLGTETATAPFTLDVIQGSRAADHGADARSRSAASRTRSARWSDGGARTHDVTANAGRDLHGHTTRASTRRQLAGTDVVGLTGSEADPGRGRGLPHDGRRADGRATALALRLAPTRRRPRVVLGLYADSGGQPTTLLASGRLEQPAGRRLERGRRSSGPTLTAGTAYWIGLLNPTDATGVLRWHDRAGGSGGAEQDSASGSAGGAARRPGRRGATWSDGPLSGYVLGHACAAPPPPVLAVRRRRCRSAAPPAAPTRRRRRSAWPTRAAGRSRSRRPTTPPG